MNLVDVHIRLGYDEGLIKQNESLPWFAVPDAEKAKLSDEMVLL
jgi:hypothetical protein